MSSSTKPALDHLILFLPADPSTNLPLLPSFFAKNFTLSPGGTHTDGLTSNTLILLQDGCYIELICFLQPEKVATHWWGPNVHYQGWKDWCLTTSTSPEENYERIKETHAEPIKGGRKRADGKGVKWAVTFPKGELGGQGIRGRVPFFCHDVTERDIRVPVSDVAKTRHPSGVLGVQQITVVVKDQKTLDETRRVYQSIFGEESGVAHGDEVSFEAGRVYDVRSLKGGATIVLRLPRNEDEAARSKEEGFWYGDVVLAAKADTIEGKKAGESERIDGNQDDVRGLWIEYV